MKLNEITLSDVVLELIRENVNTATIGFESDGKKISLKIKMEIDNNE